MGTYADEKNFMHIIAPLTLNNVHYITYPIRKFFKTSMAMHLTKKNVQ